MMRISVIGIDFRTAPVEVRERVSLNRVQTMEFLRAIHDEGICEEAMVLCTCNRTEIYFVSRDGGPAPERLPARLAEVKGAPQPEDASAFRRRDGLEAVGHLFRVTASLEAQVVGEHEITGQVKSAYRMACEARTARFLLHKLLHRAFRLAKRVRNETNLAQGTASISQAAADLAGEVFDSLAGRTVLLVGTGTAGRLAAQALVRSGADNLIVANRTLEKAQQLARSFTPAQAAKCPAIRRRAEHSPQPGGDSSPARASLATRAIGLSEIPAVIADADLVVGSTGSDKPVLRRAELGEILDKLDHPLVLIDISVPRSAEAALGELPNVRLYNIDSLNRVVAGNLERRRKEIPLAEAIVGEEVRRFDKWFSSLDAVPTVKLLQQRAAAVLEAELKRHAGKFNAADREQLEQFARSLSRRILHGPVSFLRGISGDDRGSSDLAAVDLLRKIFKLDEMEEGE